MGVSVVVGDQRARTGGSGGEFEALALHGADPVLFERAQTQSRTELANRLASESPGTVA
jgi:hypothetical protein